MKPFLMTIVSLFSASLFIQQANAQEASDNTSSLLWEISGNGLEQSSYLYGTIHMICEDDYFEPEGLEKAFAETDQLVVEVDITDPTIQMEGMKYSMMDDGNSLDKLISEEDYARLDKFFNENVTVPGTEMKLPLSAVKSMKPFLLSQFIMAPFIECENLASYEEKFIARSKKDKESVKSLESIKEVMGVIDQIPVERQAAMMIESLDGMEDAEGFSFNDLVVAYKSQDLAELGELLSELEMEDSEFGSLLLEKRNMNWMDDLTGYITDQSSLVAVGAAHLSGEDGLIELLRKDGYTVTAVK